MERTELDLLGDRLSALENARYQQQYDNQYNHWFSNIGNQFTDNDALGHIAFDALLGQLDTGDIQEITQDATMSIFDALQNDINALQKMLKQHTRMTEDAIDAVQDELDSAQKLVDTGDTVNEQVADTDATLDDFASMPAELPMDDIDLAAEPAPTMPAEPAPAPAPSIPADVPAEPAPQNVVSDANMKNVIHPDTAAMLRRVISDARQKRVTKDVSNANSNLSGNIIAACQRGF